MLPTGIALSFSGGTDKHGFFSVFIRAIRVQTGSKKMKDQGRAENRETLQN
jgi:hypothetical protein